MFAVCGNRPSVGIFIFLKGQIPPLFSSLSSRALISCVARIYHGIPPIDNEHWRSEVAWAGYISRWTDSPGVNEFWIGDRVSVNVVQDALRPGGVTICAGRLRGSRRSSEMARTWRGLCPAVDCSGRMMMMMTECHRVLGEAKTVMELTSNL
jgi:hypothetical protein